MALSHFSEDPTITRFVPRPPLERPEVEPLVWTVDDWHAPLYFFPRDCPRVCFWPLPTTTPDDSARWFATVPGRMVIAIESAWLERLRAARLYRYRMPEETFVSIHDHGVHVSREPVVPRFVEPVGDLLAALVDAGWSSDHAVARAAWARDHPNHATLLADSDAQRAGWTDRTNG